VNILARLDSIQTAGDAKATVFVSADPSPIRCACKPSHSEGSGRAAGGLRLQHLSDTGRAVTLVPNDTVFTSPATALPPCASGCCRAHSDPDRDRHHAPCERHRRSAQSSDFRSWSSGHERHAQPAVLHHGGPARRPGRSVPIEGRRRLGPITHRQTLERVQAISVGLRELASNRRQGPRSCRRIGRNGPWPITPA